MSSGPPLIVSLPKPPAKPHAADRLERAFDHQAVVAGTEVGHQPPPGAVGRAGHRRRAVRGVPAARADRHPLFRGDAEGLAGVVVGDDELVAATAADDLQASAAAGRRVEFHVSARFRRLFLAARGGPAFRPLATVAPLAAVDRVAAAAAAEVIVARASVDRVRLRAADQGVPEGRAFEALEAEELVVAVAVGAVLAQRDPDAAALAARPRGREGGDIPLAGAARHAVVAVVAVNEIFAPGPAVDDVDPEVTGHLVAGAGPAEDLVVAEVAAHLVLVAGAAVDFVVAAAAVHLIRPKAAADQVVAEAAEDHVVAFPAPDHVAFRRPRGSRRLHRCRRSPPAARGSVAAHPSARPSRRRSPQMRQAPAARQR